MPRCPMRLPAGVTAVSCVDTGGAGSRRYRWFGHTSVRVCGTISSLRRGSGRCSTRDAAVMAPVKQRASSQRDGLMSSQREILADKASLESSAHAMTRGTSAFICSSRHTCVHGHPSCPVQLGCLQRRCCPHRQAAAPSQWQPGVPQAGGCPRARLPARATRHI